MTQGAAMMPDTIMTPGAAMMPYTVMPHAMLWIPDTDTKRDTVISFQSASGLYRTTMMRGILASLAGHQYSQLSSKKYALDKAVPKVVTSEAYCDKANILAGSLAWYNLTAARGATTANRLSVFVLSVAHEHEDFSRKQRNSFMHYLHGNWFTTREWWKPHAKSHLWHTRISLYNGMVVFRFFDYQTHFEAYVCRRGWYYVFCSDPSSSPKLYQCLRKAVTSKRGGPGCRRTPADPLLRSVMSASCVKSCGNENRSAFGGCHRGFRSAEALERRLHHYRNTRAEARRTYRAYGKGFGDGRADHSLLEPPPPQPKQAVVERSRKKLTCQQNLQNNASVFRAVMSTAVSPCKLYARSLKLATWNVEGLREVAKYDQIFAFMRKENVHMLAMQETHSTSIQEFSKDGFLILHSAAAGSPNHGVGFIVSPSLRPYVQSFMPLGPRLCSVVVNTSPRPLHVYCAYAPSLVQDAAEDTKRKREFWDHLSEQTLEVDSPHGLIIVGDLNARLDKDIDPTGVHVGSETWGKRLSIDSPERDNAVYLLEFLQSFDMKLPQTFMSSSPARKVTYKETSCTDHLLRHPEVMNWTTLDYVISNLSPSFEITDLGSHFQQAVNTRHLPLLCSLSISLPISSPKPKPPPALDLTQTAMYSQKLESSFLQLCNHPLGPQSTAQGHVLAYTDGSCVNNRVISQANPAGWGFVVSNVYRDCPVHPTPTSHWISSHGRVCANPDCPEYAGAQVPSNNTAELQALVELFDYLYHYASLPVGQMIHVYTDSQYAMNILLGDSIPSTHFTIVARMQKYWFAIRNRFHITIEKVPSHVGIPGNELADQMARAGNHSIGSLGRFSRVPSHSLQPPEAHLDLTNWESMTLNDQNAFFRRTIDEAKKLIPVLPLQPRKAWISRGTLDLITTLRDSTGLTPEEVKAFRKCIKKSARQDKRLFVKNNLTKDYESTPSQWTTLRKLKKPFSTKTPGIRDPEGKLHSTKQKPEVFCKYLTQHVWKSADEQMPPQSMLHPVIPEIFRPFTEEDLYQCMKQLQVGKATGPDGIPAELIKRAPYVVQKFILSHYNKCLRTGSIPDAWLLSEVVMLVKDARKDTLSLDNYRPISLTDVFYKLYAALLQKRLAFYVDPRIRDTQYGFRRGKSTSQPIHILRRLIETHERQQSPLHILFVDWAKAFDSVSFAAIERSLVRLGVPAAFVRAVMAIYNNPQFRVKDSGSTSEVGVQSRGVRQGCPLSPYLFDIILTCLFADVEASYEEQFGILTGVLRLPSCLWDLEYADDTVLMSHTYVQLNRLLHLLQFHALKIGLQLNLDKCKHLPIHSNHRVQYTSRSAQCVSVLLLWRPVAGTWRTYSRCRLK